MPSRWQRVRVRVGVPAASVRAPRSEGSRRSHCRPVDSGWQRADRHRVVAAKNTIGLSRSLPSPRAPRGHLRQSRPLGDEPNRPPSSATGRFDSRPAVYNRHVLALDVTGVLQAALKCAQAICVSVRRLAVEVSNNRQRRLLRACGKRRDHRRPDVVRLLIHAAGALYMRIAKAKGPSWRRFTTTSSRRLRAP